LQASRSSVSFRCLPVGAAILTAEGTKYNAEGAKFFMIFSKFVSLPELLGEQVLRQRALTLIPMPDGKFILLPQRDPDRPDEPVFVFDNFACFKFFYDQDRFPIQNEPGYSYFSNSTPEWFKLNDGKVDYYRNYVETKLNMKISEITMAAVKGAYEKVLTLDYDKIEDIDDIFFAVSMLFGDVVRGEMNGKWILEKKYGNYNPYYVPAILADGKVYPFIEVVWPGMRMKFDNFELRVKAFWIPIKGSSYIVDGSIIIGVK
jgi:hypothetical protein